MKDPGLTAMVPVDHATAVKKRWHKIPFEPLLERLHEKTSHRVIRGDDQIPVGERPKPEGIKETVWKEFQSRTTETESWVEYRLGD